MQNLLVLDNFHVVLGFGLLRPKHHLALHKLGQLRLGKGQKIDDFVDPAKKLIAPKVILENRLDYFFLEIPIKIKLFCIPILMPKLRSVTLKLLFSQQFPDLHVKCPLSVPWRSFQPRYEDPWRARRSQSQPSWKS